MGPQTSPIEDKTRIAGVLSANRHLRKGQVRLGGDPTEPLNLPANARREPGGFITR
jgi:hypothetical protein